MIADARRGVAGVWALLKGDPSFPDYFDVGANGFARSFLAAILSAPVYAFVIAGITRAAEEARPGSDAPLLLIQSALNYAIIWAALPLTAPFLLRLAGLERQLFSPWVVVHNWALFVLHFVMAAGWLLFLAGIIDGGTAANIHVSVYLPIALVLHWRVTTAVLQIPWITGAALACAHVLLSLVGQMTLDRLLHGG